MTNEEISRQITRYLNGELSDAEEDQLWIEFLKDQDRFRQFETELNLHDLFHNKGFNPQDEFTDSPENESNKRHWGPYYAAAAIVVLIFGFYSYFYAVPEAEDLAVAEIELSNMLGGDVYRSDDSENGGLGQEVNRAIATALEGDFRQAREILDRLDHSELSDREQLRVEYNMGVLAYNMGEYQKAAGYFSQLNSADQTPGYIRESARWYQANAYLKLGETERAVPLLQTLLESNAIYSEQAQMVLNQLETGMHP